MRKYIKKAVYKMPVLHTLLADRKNLFIDKGILQLEKGQLEADIRELKQTVNSRRNFLASHYIHGNGIEIGAAHLPIKMPPNATVKYVDVFSADDLRRVFPEEYTKVDIVDVDVVDDGEKLSKFSNNSLDFIIANHFIEHCLDPIGTILNMYAKLRKEGTLYMAVPDKRYTFDKPRAITSYAHLLEEHKDKSKTRFRKDHTEEFILHTDKKTRDVNKRLEELLESGFRIHYHVWTQKEITEMFVRLAHDFKIDLEIEAVLKNGHEVIYVLRKETPLTLRQV